MALVSEPAFLHVSYLLAPERATVCVIASEKCFIKSSDYGSKTGKLIGRCLAIVLVYKNRFISKRFRVAKACEGTFKFEALFVEHGLISVSKTWVVVLFEGLDSQISFLFNAAELLSIRKLKTITN